MSKVSKKRQSFNYSALSADSEVEITPSESKKIVRVLIWGVLSANLIKVD